MTDTAELIARLRERAKAHPKIYSWENETHQLEWKAADALAAQAQEIERLKAGVFDFADDTYTQRDQLRQRAETAEAEVKRITRMAIGDIYAEWGRRVEAAEARVRELERQLESVNSIEWIKADRDAIEAKTIERYEVVIETYRFEHDVLCKRLAAAIRALNPSSVSS